MSRVWNWSAGLACLAALALSGAAVAGEKKAAAAAGCAQHGTTIDFVDTPADAAKQARKDGKLVFVLHVSGNFEDPRFT